METHDHKPGWLPLSESPQFEFCQTTSTTLFEQLHYTPFEKGNVQYENSLTFNFTGTVSQAMEKSFEDVRGESPGIDSKFIESSHYYDSENPLGLQDSYYD